MKKLIYIIFPIFICSISTAQSYHIENGDTINMIDENNLKQGFWRIFGKMKKLPGYEPDQVVEEGNYESSRKQGIWKFFFANGKVKSEIAYVNSRPNGYYKTYYENGQLEEEGAWKNNRNTGEFKRFHENGQLAQAFTFNETGKRDGRQEYYYENGQLMIEGNWAGGKEDGVITEYFENGDIKAKKAFNGGTIDVSNTQTFEPKNPVKDKEAEELSKAPVEVVKATAEDKVNMGSFDGNGEHTMYNKNKQISKSGFFKNYRLMEGKLYLYDEDGILLKIKKFKSGRYIGDAPLPKE
ncbi:MAG: toxin-antitoxin system YwqK family antitoxin [Flavobacteriales bacterium]|nr:toxin-antitoxin system YwqK family antitoxin [Flavobacteriales bacterium]MCB9363584.1 toxin-antitoxin system YwqK family antitoxin [Flavobacteriales bacterium]